MPLPHLPAGVFVIGGLVVLTLLLVANRYGYLGDELYFVVTGLHVAGRRAGQSDAGAVPGGRLVRAGRRPSLDIPGPSGGGGWRLGGLVSREFGAPRRHQIAAAAAVAMTALTLVVGHLFERRHSTC